MWPNQGESRKQGSAWHHWEERSRGSATPVFWSSKGIFKILLKFLSMITYVQNSKAKKSNKRKRPKGEAAVLCSRTLIPSLAPQTQPLLIHFCALSVVSDCSWAHGLQPARLLCDGILQARILEWEQELTLPSPLLLPPHCFFKPILVKAITRVLIMMTLNSIPWHPAPFPAAGSPCPTWTGCPLGPSETHFLRLSFADLLGTPKRIVL